MERKGHVKGFILLGIVLGLGCGYGKSQDDAYSDETAGKHTEHPKQLAQATPVAAVASDAPAGSATIQGTVRFSGSAPEQASIKMDADPQCLLQHKEPVLKQEVVVNPNGTLRHVFVYVKGGLEGRAFTVPSQPVRLDQHGCVYHPQVLGIQVNQPLEITNSDPTLHNVNCKSSKSQPFNIAQPVKGMKTIKKFTSPEIMIKCSCNVHPWMAAYIGVAEHPYFSVTGDDGAFRLTGLASGQYTIEAWHQKYAAQTQVLSVGDGQTQEVDFEFKAE